MTTKNEFYSNEEYNNVIVNELKKLAFKAAKGEIAGLLIVPVDEDEFNAMVFSPDGSEGAANVRAQLHLSTAQVLGNLLELEINKDDSYVEKNEELLREVASSTMAAGLLITQKAFKGSQGENDE